MKAASIVFEGLDATVEGFAQSIGNAMFDVSQQAGQVTFDQFFEGEEPIIAEVVGLEEPVIARAFQCRVATSQQSGVFLPAHLIYGLPQQSSDVELIVNDLRLRARFPHGTGVRSTHIHRNGFDRSENVRWQRFQSHDCHRRRAVFHNIKNTHFLQIVEERTITESFWKTLLMDAQVWHLFQFAPGQSSHDRTTARAMMRSTARQSRRSDSAASLLLPHARRT